MPVDLSQCPPEKKYQNITTIDVAVGDIIYNYFCFLRFFIIKLFLFLFISE